MPLDFPNTPTIGTVYTGTNNVIYIFDGVRWNGNNTGNLIPAANLTYDLGSTSTQWRNLYVGNAYVNGQPVGSVTTGTTAPTGGLGKLWYNPDAGRLYIYYDSYWVDASPPIGSSGGSIDLTAVSTNVLPTSDLTYNLGSPTKQWKSLYVGTSTIYIGGTALSVSTSGSLTVGGNSAVSKLEYFGGEGNGPRDAAAISWNTSTFTFNIPGKELLTAIYDLKLGNKIRAANTLGLDREFTIAGNARQWSTNGFQMASIDVAETTSTNVFVYSLYLPVKDKSATLANGTWTLSLSTLGGILLPDGTTQSTAYTGTNILVTSAVSATTASFATTSGYATSFNTSTLVTSAVYASTASGNFTVPGNLNINGGTIYNNGYALSTATSFNTSTLVSQAVSATTASWATTASYAQSFNTSTLVTSAVSATTASFATTSGYATSFNTSTLVTSAVSATTASFATTSGYATSFNTSTLVSSAVSATNIVNGTWTLTLSATGQLSLPSSLKFPDNSVQTTAWTPSNVSQDVTFSGNVTFNSSSTYVLSTNTVYTDNIIELHYTSTWAVNDGKDIGLRFHYYDTQDRNAFFGRDNTTGYLEWLVNSSADTVNNVTGTNGTFRLGSIILTDITASSSTTTGALQVAGGVGIGGGLYVGGTVTATNFILNGYQVSTSTGGITSPYAGIFTSTNTTAASSTTTGALQVAGGVGIGGGLYVGGTVTATTFTGLASAGTTATTAAALGYLGLPQSATNTSATLAIGDSGKHIYVNTASQTMTIPANSSVAYPIGTTLTFIAGPSATTVSIAITTDTMYLAGTGTTSTRTLAAHGMATAVKVAATTWYINGTGLT